MLVSVVTAVYNDEKYIRIAVESILNQTFSDFEYIIVDDGSTDNTINILQDLAKKDARITILNQKNHGAAAARNLAINSAKGEYIAIQDSDDISYPNRLKIQLEQLLKSERNLISCTAYNIIGVKGELIASSNKIYKDITNNILEGRFCICSPTMMVSKELIMKVGGYNTFYNKSKVEDFDLILKILEIPAFVEQVRELLYEYRIREIIRENSNNKIYLDRVYENHVNRINKRPENYTPIEDVFVKTENYVLKRQAREIIFAENYSRYVRFYLKNFFKLPVNNYFIYFIYAIIPSSIKKVVKKISHIFNFKNAY